MAIRNTVRKLMPGSSPERVPGTFGRYLDSLAAANGLTGDIQWLFYPGMLAESRSKWWGDFRFRHADHEGIDICFYRLPGRSVGRSFHRLGPGALVPALADGIVLNICEDFLGHSVVIQWGETNSLRTILVYSHTVPLVEPGSRVKRGQMVARVFDTRTRGSVLPPHLHLSCIEVPEETAFGDLNWHLFPHRDRVNLINPVFV